MWCALVVLAIAGIGAPAVWAGEATSGPVHVVKPEGPPVDLATLVALNRMEEAERRLELVRTRAEKGLASPEDVKEVERRYDEAMAALDEVTRKGGAGPKVTVEVKDATLGEALELIFKGTDQSVVVQPAVAGIRPVNLSLKNVQLEDAVKVVAKINGLQYEHVDNLWVVFPEEGVLTVGGVRVPLLGAVPAIPGELGQTSLEFVRRGGDGGDERMVFINPRIVKEPGLEAPFETRRAHGGVTYDQRGRLSGRPSFEGEDVLVDLSVRDMPLTEVAAQLSRIVGAEVQKRTSARQVAAQSGEPEPQRERWRYQVEIIADESLRSLKVSARVYKWPAGQVLDMLIDQADLTCAVDRQDVPPPAGGVGMGVTTVRVFLVPRPVLEVTGPGIPEAGMGGIGGGGRGGPVSGLGGGGASE